MESTQVAIVGMGTVGSGVAKLLLQNGDRVARHSGRKLILTHAVVRDAAKHRDVELPSSVLTTDINRVIADPKVKVVALLVGGLEPARTFALKLLDAGKDIVTANKALIAEHGNEIFDRARKLGRAIAFDASVGGGIPIITNINQCLTANNIVSLRGILNGTTNFIVSQMEEQGALYADALAEAQRLGFAEADPTMDVSGADAAQKLAILSHLAFGARVHWREIPCVGIEALSPIDLKFAKELGYRIKLVAAARLRENGLEAHVSPTLVRMGRPLAEVRGAYNAITVKGDAVGELFFHGLGAGQMPTASAVLADMIDMAAGRTQITFDRSEHWSLSDSGVGLCDFSHLLGRFYLRFLVEDHPGVLAEVAGVLGRNRVSIASVIQHEPEGAANDRLVPLVIMTHQAAEGAAAAACEEMTALKSVRPGSVRMRVVD